MGLTDNLFQRKTQANIRNADQRKAQRGNYANKPISLNQYRIDNRPRDPGSGRVTSSLPERPYPDRGQNMKVEKSGRCSLFPNIQSNYCICHRPSCVVTCTRLRCDWSAIGRARRLCYIHSSVFFLMDLPACPRCGADVKEVSDRLAPIDFNKDADE